jgi:hypothetical protein
MLTEKGFIWRDVDAIDFVFGYAALDPFWRTPNEVWKGILAGKSFQEIVALGT